MPAASRKPGSPDQRPRRPRPWPRSRRRRSPRRKSPARSARGQRRRVRLADDGVAERMLRASLGGRDQREQVRPPAARAGGTDDVGDPRLALGQRAGLVEHDRPDRAEPLERLGVAEQDAGLGALAGPDHDRGRRGQAEGAGAGDDQDGDRVEQRQVEGRRRAERRTRPRTSARRGRGRPGRSSRSRRRRGAGSAPASPGPRTTRRMILASTVPAPTRVARKVRVPVVLSVPPMTRSSARLVTGRLSPVIMLSSTPEAPSTTTPSTAIVSPGRTRTMSPTRTSRDRHVDFGAVAQHARGPRREADQPPDRVRGVRSGAGLEVPPEEDQRDDRGGGVEVERQAVLAHPDAGGLEERRERGSRRPSRRRRRSCRPRSGCSCRRPVAQRPSRRRRRTASRPRTGPAWQGASWNERIGEDRRAARARRSSGRGRPAAGSSGSPRRSGGPGASATWRRAASSRSARASRPSSTIALARRPTRPARRARRSRRHRPRRRGRRRSTRAGSNRTVAVSAARLTLRLLDALDLLEEAGDAVDARRAGHPLDGEVTISMGATRAASDAVGWFTRILREYCARPSSGCPALYTRVP